MLHSNCLKPLLWRCASAHRFTTTSLVCNQADDSSRQLKRMQPSANKNAIDFTKVIEAKMKVEEVTNPRLVALRKMASKNKLAGIVLRKPM